MPNPFVDQRRLLEGKVATRLYAGIVRVTGADRHALLTKVFSQELSSLSPGDSREALQLDAQGRIHRVVHVLETADSTLLIAPERSGLEFANWLDARIFFEDVHVVDVTADHSVWGATRSFGPLAWHDPWPTIVEGGVTYGAVDAPTWRWVETILGADERPDVDTVDSSIVDPIRIVAGRPSLNEVDDRSLPHELDWLRTAVHLSKGCYPGQETVAKIHHAGHPPRRLVRLSLDGSESTFVVSGDSVTHEGAAVGIITSAGIHFDEGPVALAVIKRGVDVAATLVVVHDGKDVPANQEVIVPPTAGATAAARLRANRQ